MAAALRRHKGFMKEYPREGAGIEAHVDASDTGYTMNKPAVNNHTNRAAMPDTADGSKKRIIPDGVVSGLKVLAVNGHSGLRALQEQR